MNNKHLAIESFIAFCDDMMIAEEGLKDIGNNTKKGIEFVWNKFIAFCKRVKEAVKKFFREHSAKHSRSLEDEIKKKDMEINALKKAVSDEKKGRIKDSEKHVDSLANSIKNHDEYAASTKAEIDELNAKIKQLEEEKQNMINRHNAELNDAEELDRMLMYFDTDFSNVCLNEGNRETYKEYIKELSDRIFSKEGMPSKNIWTFKNYSESVEDIRKKLRVDDIKKKLRVAEFSQKGRIQESFILTKLKIVDNDAKFLEWVKNSLDAALKSLEKIDDASIKKNLEQHISWLSNWWKRDITVLTALQTVLLELLDATKFDTGKRKKSSSGLNKEDKFTASKFKEFEPQGYVSYRDKQGFGK